MLNALGRTSGVIYGICDRHFHTRLNPPPAVFQVNSLPPGGPRLRIVFDKAPQPSIVAVGSLRSSGVRGSGVCYNVSGGHMSWGLCKNMTDTITVIFANSGLIPNGLTLEVEARTDTSRTAVISLHLNGTLVSDRQIKSEAYARYKFVLPDYILTSSEDSTNSLVVSLSAVGHVLCATQPLLLPLSFCFGLSGTCAPCIQTRALLLRTQNTHESLHP